MAFEDITPNWSARGEFAATGSLKIPDRHFAVKQDLTVASCDRAYQGKLPSTATGER
jgi:hypothetical protein